MMSEPENEKQQSDDSGENGDDLLPEDLQASEDNPLAEPLPEAERPEDPAELDMDGGKTPEESGDGSTDGDEPDDSTSDGASTDDDDER